MHKKGQRTPTSFRSILFEELGAEFAGRVAELGVRIVPQGLFEDLVAYVPERILKIDDVQDAVARLPRIGARFAGFNPLVGEILQVVTKEGLEEAGKRAGEIPTDEAGQKLFARRLVSGLPSFKKFDELKGGTVTEKKSTAKNIMQVMGEIVAAPAVAGDPNWNEEWNDLLGRLSPLQHQVLREQGPKRSTTAEQLKLVLLMENGAKQKVAFMDLITHAPEIKGALEDALEKLGVKEISGDFKKHVDEANAGLNRHADRMRREARRLRRGGF